MANDKTDPKPLRVANQPESGDKGERYGQSGAQSGNAGMKQKEGAAPTGVNADANDDRQVQSGAQGNKPKPAKGDVVVSDPDDEVE